MPIEAAHNSTLCPTAGVGCAAIFRANGPQHQAQNQQGQNQNGQ
jgi:hypothetical protein